MFKISSVHPSEASSPQKMTGYSFCWSTNQQVFLDNKREASVTEPHKAMRQWLLLNLGAGDSAVYLREAKQTLVFEETGRRSAPVWFIFRVSGHQRIVFDTSKPDEHNLGPHEGLFRIFASLMTSAQKFASSNRKMCFSNQQSTLNQGFSA